MDGPYEHSYDRRNMWKRSFDGYEFSSKISRRFSTKKTLGHAWVFYFTLRLWTERKAVKKGTLMKKILSFCSVFGMYLYADITNAYPRPCDDLSIDMKAEMQTGIFRHAKKISLTLRGCKNNRHTKMELKFSDLGGIARKLSFDIAPTDDCHVIVGHHSGEGWTFNFHLDNQNSSCSLEDAHWLGELNACENGRCGTIEHRMSLRQ